MSESHAQVMQMACGHIVTRALYAFAELGIADQLKIPVRYIGVGERVDDLRDFDPEAFVEALLDEGPEVSAPAN